MKKFIAIALMLFSLTLSAQTPTQESMIREQIEKRGLTEAEVRSRLSAEGISIDSPEDAMKNQGKIKAILDEMEKEKKGGDNAKTSANNSTEVSSDRASMIEAIEAEKRTTENEAENAQKAVMKTVNDRKIFGRSIFTDQALEVFRTTDGARAPDNYILGAGDIIRVTIFGSSQEDLLLEINSQGFVQPSNLPKIFVQGMELSTARNLIIQRLSSYYTFNTNQISVTIQTVRTINVNIFGEVERVGGFNVSALNTALNALSAAGGPTEIGSVRNIELISGKKRRIIDVYAVMDNPSDMFQYDLQHNDIIYVPVAQKLVTLTGAVRRPMRYELKEGETLKDLIRFAGGLRSRAYPELVIIRSIDNGEETITEYNLREALESNSSIPLKDGDQISIREIEKELERYVEIEGDDALFYPGRYSLDQTPTLRSLLDKAELRSQAKTSSVFIERTREDEAKNLLVVNYDSLVKQNTDYGLQRLDVVRVFTEKRYAITDSITVAGDVRQPFSKSYRFDQRLSIANALAFAGGTKPTATQQAYVFRKNIENPEKITHIPVNLVGDWDFELQPGDRLMVYNEALRTRIPQLSVQGEVIEPFTTAFEPGISLTQVLKMAGGVTEKASRERVEVFRALIDETQGVRFERIILKVDEDMNVLQPTGFNLQPFDQVVVRSIPQYQMDRAVQISGEVFYPGTYPLESGRYRLSDLIKKAGGLTEQADKEFANIMRAHEGRGPIGVSLKKVMSNQGNDSFDPVLFEEDVITIRRFENVFSINILATRLGLAKRLAVKANQKEINPDELEYNEAELQLLDQLREPDLDPGTSTELLRQLNLEFINKLDSENFREQEIETRNFVFRGKRSANWYIKNYAGGYARKADRGSVTVTLPNGQVVGTREYFWGLWRNYPDVVAGSEIALDYKPEKKPKPASEKTDWGSLGTGISQAVISAVTLILLLRNVN